MPPPKPAPTKQDRLAIGLLATAYLAVVLPIAFLGMRWLYHSIQEQQRIREQSLKQFEEYQKQLENNSLSQDFTSPELEDLKKRRQELADKLKARDLEQTTPSTPQSAIPGPQQEFMEVWEANQTNHLPFHPPRFIGYLEPGTINLPPNTKLEYAIDIGSDGRVIQINEITNNSSRSFPDLKNQLSSALFTPARKGSYPQESSLHAWSVQKADGSWTFEYDQGVEIPSSTPSKDFFQSPEAPFLYDQWLTASNSPPINIIIKRPDYPPSLLRYRIEDEVLIRATIDEYGFVTQPKIIECFDRKFARAALDALPQWQFLPAKKNGIPTAESTLITIPFKLQDPPQDEF